MRLMRLVVFLYLPFSVSDSLPLTVFHGAWGLLMAVHSPRVGMWVNGLTTVPPSSHACATQRKDELGERRGFTGRQSLLQG